MECRDMMIEAGVLSQNSHLLDIVKMPEYQDKGAWIPDGYDNLDYAGNGGRKWTSVSFELLLFGDFCQL